MKSKETQSAPFAVCIDNSGYPASLELGKLYPLVPDQQAAKHGYVRVVDESGDDYGYSAKRFFILEVPQSVAKALRARPGETVHRAIRKTRPVIASRRRKT